MRGHLRRAPDRWPLLAAVADGIEDVPEVARPLSDTLDETGQVRDDASPELRRARALTRELRTEMEARLMRLVRDPDMANTVAETYVTLRNGRFVVPLRTSAAHTVAGVVQDRSQSGETVFLEPLFAVDLNNRLLLSAKDEEAEERRVRAELTDLVRANASRLEVVEALLADVDALAAAAAFAEQHDCTRPRLGADQVRLCEARHPLLLEAGRPVVPIDLRIPADRRGLAITGPNAGGKTVAIKTLGLCVAMAHAGLFVPVADDGLLPHVRAIAVDIGDEQSIDRDLSTFTGHIQNLARIARQADAETLVLLDEPGAGTDPIEGAALAVGLLTDLLARGPMIVFTSHFPQVKTFALATPELDVAAFDVDPETGAPRFRLAYHTVGQSLALPIARRHGLPERALAMAERLLSGESRELARAVARLEESRTAFEHARAESEAERQRLAVSRAEAESLAADLRVAAAPTMERGSRGLARLPARSRNARPGPDRGAAKEARARGAPLLRAQRR